MKVDIWSDIICPFCYIGKRKFEMALAQFPHKEKVEIEWHSYELDPNAKTLPDTNVYDYLAERKGQSREWSVQMHDQLTAAAHQVGLTYNFDKAIIANTFDAHRLIQLAKQYDLGGEAEERLFKAYFTEGKNIADHVVLLQLAKDLRLDESEVHDMLAGNAFEEEVRNDEANAGILGIRGVPFYVIHKKYGVSGAQSPAMFLQALHHAWKDFEKENPGSTMDTQEGDSCSLDGNC